MFSVSTIKPYKLTPNAILGMVKYVLVTVNYMG
jgi:hypothetical protein